MRAAATAFAQALADNSPSVTASLERDYGFYGPRFSSVTVEGVPLAPNAR